jgi:hypothetical protein
MTKNMLVLLDNTLASTARTVRAVVLIAAVTVATGTAPGLDLLVPAAPATTQTPIDPVR